jgi:phosphatidylglycerophosphate synthase
MIKDIKKLIFIYRDDLFNYQKNSFFESIYRSFAIVTFPITKRISPNLISLISVFLSFIAFMFVKMINLNYLLIFFIISFILDFSDGLVARYYKKTSFNGRFIDGLFDIIILGFLHIIFFQKLIENESLFKNYFYLLVIFLLPIQHLIIDRYSSIARWINEQSSRNLSTYYRNIFLGKFTKFLYDLQHLCIWSLIIEKSFNFYLIEIFFILSFIASISNFGIYIHLSRKNFSSIENQDDNNVKKKNKYK